MMSKTVNAEERAAAQRSHKIARALEALPLTTPGDWWVDDRGEMHNDPVGNVKLAKCVDGHSLVGRDANRALLSAAQELAYEVIALRAELSALLSTAANSNQKTEA
jgi:hypothetical protein